MVGQYSSKIIVSVTVVIAISLCLQLYIYVQIEEKQDDEIKDNIIIWWTPFTGEMGATKKCGSANCFFTNNISYYHHPNVKGLLFYGSKFNRSDLPLPRGRKIWALLHEESPRNTPVLLHEPMLSLFNYSSTFSRFSDVPLTLQYLSSLEELTGKTYYIPVEEKNKLLTKLSPLIYIQSDCSTPTNRDSYVVELMKYIKVDSYGQCLKNKQIPESLEDSMKNLFTAQMFEFVAQYKFYIAFENGICNDYITEKLWRPLISGVVPIYIGSPSVMDWIPNNHSVILAHDFESPQKLANYLDWLNSNDEEYNRFLSHKINGTLTNSALVKTMNSRSASLDDSYDMSSFIEEFECYICRQTQSENTAIVRKEHYDCPKPVSVVDHKFNDSNWWHTDWDLVKCEATTLRRLIDDNIHFTDELVDQIVFENIKNGNCEY